MPRKRDNGSNETRYDLDSGMVIGGPRSSGGAGIPDKALWEVERKKAARERERVRAREKYKEQKAERMASADYRPPGRPLTGERETLRPVMVGESMHKRMKALAASRLYKEEYGNRVVSMRELVEKALEQTYPELTVSAEPTAEEIAEQEAAMFGEIVMLAMQEPGDTETNWNSAGNRIAYRCPEPGNPLDAFGKPKRLLEFEMSRLGYHLHKKLKSGADISHITTLAALVKDYQKG